jgi:hypothetical protein
MADERGAVVLSPVNTRERGYATDTVNGWWDDLTREETPELRWPLSVKVYDRMRRQDAQAGSVLRAVTSPIIRTQWSVDGTGCDPSVTEFVARNLGLPIHGADPEDDNQAPLRGRDRFSWSQHLRLALLMLPFGHMYFEQVYRFSEDKSQLLLRKLGPRLPHTISRINVARDGGLISIEQYGTSALNAGISALNAGTALPVNRLVAYVLEREGGNWLGQSLLRSAYKNWLLKDRGLRTWSTSIDRQGMGVPFYTAAETEKSLDAGLKLAQSTRAGENAGGAMPNGAKMALLGVTGELPDIDAFIRYQDEQIARAVLAHFLNLGTQTGSWALGTTFADFFTLSLQAIAEEVRSTASAHIVEDLVDLNFGPTVPAPQIVFDEIGSRVSELDRVREAAGLTSDAELTKFLRTHSSPEGA